MNRLDRGQGPDKRRIISLHCIAMCTSQVAQAIEAESQFDVSSRSGRGEVIEMLDPAIAGHTLFTVRAEHSDPSKTITDNK